MNKGEKDLEKYKLWANGYLAAAIMTKMEELENKHNNFRDMTFNVPTQVERDFIAYETLKIFLEEMMSK